MDEFAQTRGVDNLFDDDFTPIDVSASETVESVSPQVQQQQQQQQPHRSARSDRAIRGSGNQTPRQPRQARPQSQLSPSEIVSSDTINGNLESSSINTITPGQNETNTIPTSQPQQPKPPSAVRGDRTLTGGTLKPKLTEDELSARMEAAKLNNEKRAEAHRVAEADEANFQQREAQASQKRKEEGAARRAMNQERERNRMRKLGAQGGREWDEGKAEQEPERGSQYRRGAHGGVVYDTSTPRGGYQDRKLNESHERREQFVPRGGRGRGDRGRGGRGRAGFAPNRAAQQAAPDPVDDFPALPTTSKPQESNRKLPPAPSNAPENEAPNQRAPSVEVTQVMQPAAGGESWADQVDGIQEGKIPEGGW